MSMPWVINLENESWTNLGGINHQAMTGWGLVVEDHSDHASINYHIANRDFGECGFSRNRDRAVR